MKLRPLHDRIIVKRLEEERTTAGGIVIPDTAAEKPSMGEVIAVGPGKTDDNGKLHKLIVKKGDRILVRRVKEEEKTAGGLYIPDTAKEKPQEGKVVATGEGRRGDDGKLPKLSVKKGDRILFGKYSGQEFKMDGADYLHMREDDIIGIVLS